MDASERYVYEALRAGYAAVLAEREAQDEARQRDRAPSAHEVGQA